MLLFSSAIKPSAITEKGKDLDILIDERFRGLKKTIELQEKALKKIRENSVTQLLAELNLTKSKTLNEIEIHIKDLE